MTVSYLVPLMKPDVFPLVVESLGYQISKDYKEKKFDAMIVTGLSGVILASAISYKYHVPFIVVRKGESTHSVEQIEGYQVWYKRVAFVDDFISSGKTLKRILDITENLLEIVCGYFYTEDRPATTLKELNTEYMRNWFPDFDFPIFSRNFMYAYHEEYL